MVEIDTTIVGVIVSSIIGLLLIIAYYFQKSFSHRRAHGHSKQKKKENVIQKSGGKKVAKKVKVQPNAEVKQSPLLAKGEEVAVTQVHDDLIEPVPETIRKKAKETSEQKAARLERQKIAKQQKLLDRNEDIVPEQKETKTDKKFTEHIKVKPAVAADGWAVVEDKKKSKPKAEPAIAAVKELSEVNRKGIVQIDSKKVGVVIGPKGATLKSIQELAGVEILTPKSTEGAKATSLASITISGSTEGIEIATKIIKELTTKGYSSSLGGGDFTESHVTIHSS